MATWNGARHKRLYVRGAYSIRSRLDNAIRSGARRAYVRVGAMLLPLGALLASTDGVLANPIAHWTFDVDASDALGAHSGALMGNASISSDGGAFAGEALVLDGDGDYVSIPYSSDFQLGIGTISLWFRGGPNSQQRVFYALMDFHHGSNHGASHGWAILGARDEMQGQAVGRIGLATGLDVVNYFGAKALLDSGTFHHFAATFQPGGSAVLYVDGQQVASAALDSPFAYIDTNPPLSIGRWGAAEAQGEPANARDYLGRIDDVQVYDCVLDAQRVQFLFQNPGQTALCIPTLSEWGMMAMAGLMLLAGGGVISRRHKALGIRQ